MTTEQFDKLIAHLNKLADAQAAISQGKNMGTFASDRKTDEGRVLKVTFKNWRRLQSGVAHVGVTDAVVVDSFCRFTIFHNLAPGQGIMPQALSPSGSWHFVHYITNGQTYGMFLGSTPENPVCATFEGNFCAIRLWTPNFTAFGPNTIASMIAT
jgi:hypothetical protein